MSEVVLFRDEVSGETRARVELFRDPTGGLQVTKGIGFGVAGPDGPGLAMADGTALGVSTSGTARLIYNNTTKRWEQSIDTAAYEPLGDIAISVNQVAHGVGADKIGGDPDFTFDPATNVMALSNANAKFGLGTTPTSQYHQVQPVATSGSPKAWLLVGGIHTTLAASTEAIDLDFALNRDVEFSAGALATQRAIVVRAPTYKFDAPTSTITDAATFAIAAAPTAGTNAIIDSSYALWVQSGSSHFGGAVEFSVGTAALPSMTFKGDLITGFSHPAANRIAVSLNAAAIMTFTTSSIRVGGIASIWNTNGAAGSPSYTFGTSTGSGMWLPSTNILAWSTNGVERWRLTASKTTYYPTGAANGTDPAVTVLPSLGSGGQSTLAVNGPSLLTLANPAFMVTGTTTRSSPGSGYSWSTLAFPASTLTFTGAGQTNLGSLIYMSLESPTITRDNSNTYTSTGVAATLFINNEPTLTNVTANGGTWSVFINEGGVRLQSSNNLQRLFIVSNNYSNTVDQPSKLVIHSDSSNIVSPATTVSWRGVYFRNFLSFSGTGQTGMGTVAHVWIERPAITRLSGGGSFTIADAANVYIEGAPNPTTVVLTNSYALWVDQGISRFDGDGTHVFQLPADATGNATAATGRVPMKIGGVTKYFRYFDD